MGEQQGNIDIFMNIVGSHSGKIKGESQDAKHKGEIDVETYSYELTQPTSKHSGGLATGKRQHGPFIVTFKTQSATPLLFGCAFNGEHLKEVTIVCRKAGKEQQEYLKFTLTTVIISKIETFYLHNDLVPRDRVTLEFRKIKVEYKEQKADGTLGGGFMAEDQLAGG